MAGEPFEDQVFEVSRQTKVGVEGTFIRNGFTALYTGEVSREATEAEVQVANEFGLKNRPPCPTCKSLMVVKHNILTGGVTPWQCKEHGIPDIEEASDD